MLAENKCGYKLLEYISIKENEIKSYKNITGAGVILKVDGKYLVGYNNWRLQFYKNLGCRDSLPYDIMYK